jgi:hypothetical protein
MKKQFLYAILAIIVSILVLIVPAIHPAGRHGRKQGVSNATMNTIREYLALNPAAVSAQELEHKRQAAYNAAATMPNRLRMKHQAHIAQKYQELREHQSEQAVMYPDKVEAPTMQQHRQVGAIKRKPKAVEQRVQQTQTIARDEQEDEAKEDAQSVTAPSYKRDIIGAVSALGLVLLYEFVIAPKMGTKKLGIAEFCTAAMNKQNPLTVKLDGQQGADAPDDEQAQAGPGFLKRFGFDILCSLFGL